ncbi:hypothetical protein AAF712_016798, partial [Marasmius tenuissimus]
WGSKFFRYLISLNPKKTLLEKIEAIKFPVNLAGEVEALKEQVLALPWDQWLGSGNERADSGNESSDGDEEESHNDNGRLNSNKERLDTDKEVSDGEEELHSDNERSDSD